jgi:superfamily II DNA/RNA helicase
VLVLDEADEMLSLGFWPDMKEVASFLPRKRQSHLFSATMPEKVRSLSRFFLTDAEDVTIEVEGGSPQMIEHFYYLAPASEKEALLARILEYENPESAIIFCNTKADVRFITAYLSKRGFNIDQISGDLAQNAREKAMAKIKSGQLRFLVATDVAARGIDISDLSAVINYTTSDSPEVYVHRTGRTGRAGKSGVAISLVSGLDIGNFKYMQTVSGIKITEKKAPTERDIARRAKQREKKRAEAGAEDEIKGLKTKVEQQLGSLEPGTIADQIERLLPFVRKFAESEEGLKELAGICTAYLNLDLNPRSSVVEAAVTEVVTHSTSDSTSDSASDGDTDAARATSGRDEASAPSGANPRSDQPASGDRPRRRRRSRSGGSSSNRSSDSPRASGSDAPDPGDRPPTRRRRSPSGGR